jgi:hypothetical protein
MSIKHAGQQTPVAMSDIDTFSKLHGSTECPHYALASPPSCARPRFDIYGIRSYNFIGNPVVRFAPAISFLGSVSGKEAHDRLGTSAAVECKRYHPHRLSLARASAGVYGWMGAFHV